MFDRQTKIKILLTALIFLLVSPLIYAEEKIIFAVTLIRHGDRTPSSEIKNSKFTYQFPEGIGGLTSLGMHQEYLLGKRMRKRYVDQLHLLPPNYQVGSMYVLSSPLDRTLMSAQSFLFGFYPPGTGPKLNNNISALPYVVQPIPIYIADADQADLLRPEHVNAKRYHQILDQYFYTSRAWKDENAKLAQDFQRWSKIFGVEIKNLNDIVDFGEYLSWMQVHGIPLPPGITKEDQNKIVKEVLRVYALRFTPKEMVAFTATPFFTKLNTDLRLAAIGKQPYKYILYSGHDYSILGAMGALGSPLAGTPPYAAHLNFELYQDGKNFQVKVWYNDKPVRLTSGKNKTSYTLEEFLDVIKPYQK